MAADHDCDVAPDPDNCFRCKCRYWRSGQGVTIQYPYGGRAAFHGPTIRERADKQIAEAKAAGIDAVPKTTIYTGR